MIKHRSAPQRAGDLSVTSWRPWPHGLVTDFDQQSQYRLRLPHHQNPFVGLSFIHSFILKRAKLNRPFLDRTICLYVCQSPTYPPQKNRCRTRSPKRCLPLIKTFWQAQINVSQGEKMTLKSLSAYFSFPCCVLVVIYPLLPILISHSSLWSILIFCLFTKTNKGVCSPQSWERFIQKWPHHTIHTDIDIYMDTGRDTSTPRPYVCLCLQVC